MTFGHSRRQFPDLFRCAISLITVAIFLLSTPVEGQLPDTSTQKRQPPPVAQAPIQDSTVTPRATPLASVVTTASRPLHVIGHLPDVSAGVIYSGKKTEVIEMDSLASNNAQDVERQILGRIPGAHFSETGGAGFPSNGLGFRGLDPTQSVEVNTRQNGINIAADVYGYPETYYTPPAEALDRIEVVRGAGSLAFGPQFGGSVNYVVRRGAPKTPPQIRAAVTAGSFGLLNSFNAVSGGGGPLTYYGFAHLRASDGSRPNSDLRQGTFYGSATYRPSSKLELDAEYTAHRNRIHMGGGLSDEQFSENSAASFRARNWLASPWNVGAVRARYAFSPSSRLETTLSAQSSDRHLVWRNEDGGPQELDAVDPSTGKFVPREVELETFRNITIESRLVTGHSLFGKPATLASGLRGFSGTMRRFEGGPGSTGSDFDMKLYGGTWERALKFNTHSASLFAEDLIRATDRLSITPGLRLEYVRSGASGYTDVDSTFTPRTTAYPLAGVGAEYVTGESTVLYGNVSGAYRPVLYAALTPFGSVIRVDPRLHAARGYNADLGWRGTIGRAVKFDAGVFYLLNRDRIGIRTRQDASGEFEESANIGTSVHRGIETYLEFDPFALRGAAPSWGTMDLFTSFAFVDASYATGEFKGNRVEQAPRIVDRTGVSFLRHGFVTTLQASYTSLSFGDANNSRAPLEDAAAGIVPSYVVFDLSMRAPLGARHELSAGVNNLTNRRYFTKRTGEYPGPGILPGQGRGFYAGFRLTF